MAGNVKEVGPTEFAADIEGGTGLTVVDFWASWCGPCLALAPTFAKLADEFAGKAAFVKVNVDEHPQLAAKFNVRSIPALLYFKDGKHVDTTVGLVPATVLSQKITSHL